MENGYINGNENIYFACRKRAAKTNERLSSRENAAELLGVSVSTLANYELGITKSVPVEMVVLMADLYNAPELKYKYCKNECPIGKSLPVATEINSLEGVTVRLLNGLDDEEIGSMKKRLLKIAEDGKIDEEEQTEFKAIMDALEALSKTISELRMLAEKYSERGGGEYGIG